MSRSSREQGDAADRQRFIIMNAARIGGLVMVLAGIAIARGALDLPRILGGVLAVLGLFEFFFVPVLLARAWNRPKP